MASLPIKNKKGTVIHRTTSETLRLGDSELNHAPSVRASGQSSNSRKKSQTSPSCSFQITGVSLTRLDLGEDSADDLDESHTDDISRITDNETPSFSEDSKDTDDHLLQPIQQQQQQQQQQQIEQQKEMGRFKVVKIESVAPFSRGRWTCFDYLDQTDNTDDYSYVFYGQKTDKVTTTNRCSSIKDVDDNIHNRRIQNPSNMNFWDPHCQEYMYRAATTPSGTMILPKQIYVPISWQRNLRARQNPNTTSVTYIHDYTRINENNTTKDQCKQDHINVIQQQQQQQQQQSKEKDDSGIEDTKNVASVSCTATIDTKIEHALDVVKTHLTRAVRLEVEELKIKINELVDRISYLEYENDLLRANVAPDVLARLGGNNCGEK